MCFWPCKREHSSWCSPHLLLTLSYGSLFYSAFVSLQHRHTHAHTNTEKSNPHTHKFIVCALWLSLHLQWTWCWDVESMPSPWPDLLFSCNILKWSYLALLHVSFHKEKSERGEPTAPLWVSQSVSVPRQGQVRVTAFPILDVFTGILFVTQGPCVKNFFFFSFNRRQKDGLHGRSGEIWGMEELRGLCVCLCVKERTQKGACWFYLEKPIRKSLKWVSFKTVVYNGNAFGYRHMTDSVCVAFTYV